MGTSDILLGGNPVMGSHPVQGGVAILLGMLHATETGISSGRVGLWLVCAFTYLTPRLRCLCKFCKLNKVHCVLCENDELRLRDAS